MTITTKDTKDTKAFPMYNYVLTFVSIVSFVVT
jgi:hypothetical protein